MQCLASVFESIGSQVVETVVVDNASTDGSLEAVRRAFPGVLTVSNPSNRGFGAACNQAMRMTTHPLILLLNSDARLTRAGLQALCNCMEQNSRCGAAGCRQVDLEGKEIVNTWNFLTPFNQVFEHLGIASGLSRRFGRRSYRPKLNGGLIDCSVDWIDGSCLMLQRAALQEVGFFDEQFFMYSEDEDLCFRLRKGGWHVCYSGAGVTFHHGGASSTQFRMEMLVHFYRSQMSLLLKHRGRAAVHLYRVLMKMVLFLKSQLPRGNSKTTRGTEALERLSALNQAGFSGAARR
jgi:GT2 family glycosyltransferase